MEMDLSAVIEKIKTEGVGQAEEKAAKILKESEEKAKGIIEAARAESAETIKKAKEEAGKFRKNSEEALGQAARNVKISLKAHLTALLDSVVRKEVSDSLTTDVLKDIIVKLVTESSQKGDFDLEILLGEQDKENLRGAIEKLLQEEIKKGITIKVSPSVKQGFRIGAKGQDVYYDFSDDAITEAFNFYLNRKLSEIIDAGVRDNE